MLKVKRWLLKCLLFFIVLIVILSAAVVIPLRWIEPPFTMVMVQRWITSEEGYELKQHWLTWAQIPKQAALAVVTAEDQRFPLHHGFDVDAIFQVLRHADNSAQLRGASTISQQVAKNVYLWTGRSWFRKGVEAWFTLLIELFWGKQRILEMYINIAEWGEGIFGLQAASFHYFSKPASKLNQMESALLASALPSPLKFNPAKPSFFLKERAEWNLLQQQRLGGVNWLLPVTQE